MEQTRLYPDMTAEEQLRWVTDFEALMQDGGGRIIDMARRRQPQWQPEDAPTVRRLVGIMLTYSSPSRRLPSRVRSSSASVWLPM